MQHLRSKALTLALGLSVASTTLAESAEPVSTAASVSAHPVSVHPVSTQPASSQPGAAPTAEPVAVPGAEQPQAAAVSPTPDPEASVEPVTLDLGVVAARIDQILADAGKDLGLPAGAIHTTLVQADLSSVEDKLFAESGSNWHVAPVLTEVSGSLVLRLLARRGTQSTLFATRADVDEANLEVRVIQALRTLTDASSAAQSRAPEPRTKPEADATFSPGQAILAAHGALIGGYFGFAMENIGGRSDARLLYPVMALGAGIGVGTSFVIAGEWDISIAEAWYLSAASTWPTAAATLIASSVKLSTPEDRFAYGSLGTLAGVTLGTLSLNFAEVGEGGALLTHSGGFFGGVLGAVGEHLVAPRSSGQPTLGVGIGISAGVLVTGFLAPHLPQLDAPRVLLIDLGGALGALAGAALASPFVVGRDFDETENRLWSGSIGLGVVLGSAIAVLLTDNKSATTTSQAAWLRAWSPDFRSVNFGASDTPSGVSLGARRKW